MPINEPHWSRLYGPNGGRLDHAAIVTRAQWRRAIREARREALMEAAEGCRECAQRLRGVSMMPNDADHWDEVALWLESRAEGKARG